MLSITPKIPEISAGIQMEKSGKMGITSGGGPPGAWSTYFGWNISTEIHRSILDKPVLCSN